MQANPKIEIRYHTEAVEARGKDRLEEVVLADRGTGDTSATPAAAMFVCIGAQPQGAMARDLVQCNRNGLILTGRDLLADGKRPKGWTLEREPLKLETTIARPPPRQLFPPALGYSAARALSLSNDIERTLSGFDRIGLRVVLSNAEHEFVHVAPVVVLFARLR